MTLEQAIAELTFKDEQVLELTRQNETLDRTVEQLRQQIVLFSGGCMDRAASGTIPTSSTGRRSERTAKTLPRPPSRNRPYP